VTIGDFMIKLKSYEHFETLKQEHTVFLFSADWCPDCLFIEPFLDELETRYSMMNFVYVDRDKFLELCEAYNIYGIPSFLAFKNNILLNSFISKIRKTKTEITQFLDTVK
jgi:thiol-disulfide isomerase/thioredoxin